METCYDYLRTYASELGSRIVEMYPPLQGPKDPLAPELKTLLRKPLPVQGMTITGCAKYLKSAKSVTIVGECGTGKTLMSAGIVHAHAESKPYSAIVMCPPHLVLKWAREIFITVPNARVFVIYDFRNGGDPKKPHGVTEMRMRNGHAVSKGDRTTLSDLRRMGRRAWRSQWTTPTYFIVSKETGKLSYFWKHSYSVRSTRLERRLIINPDTGLPIPNPEGGYLREAHFTDSKVSENIQRASKGTHGHSPLWQADNSKTQRIAPLEFIGRYMRNYWDYAIADELHQLANDTAQGNNLDVLRRCAGKLIGATGTLMGGYASDLFRLFFRMNPRKMVAEGFEYSSGGEGEFQALYGVLESIEKIRHSDNACSHAEKSTSRLVRRPGASPLLFGKFLMSSAVFVSLEDIAEFLPPYEETVLQIPMGDALQKAYQKIEKDIRKALEAHKKNRSLMSLMMHRLMVYPDHPFGIGEIWGKVFDPHVQKMVPFLVTRAPELPRDAVYAKEQQLIDDIRLELSQGRRCQVYATFTSDYDVLARLEQVLQNAGFRVAVLRPTVPPLERERWYERQVQNGIEVVLCHPKLVETGLDLLWFPTIYFYETGYSLHTLRQASRRSWRIGQFLDVRVKFFVYLGTTQVTCLRLMGRKMLVALMMEGKFSGEGIHSMGIEEDLVAAMARELVEQGGVGESADAVWDELKRERISHFSDTPKPEAPREEEPVTSGFDLFDGPPSHPSGITLVHSNPEKRKKPDSIWPTGHVIGEQLKLFG
jgi:superfamily II DNA or RNA helicase